MATRSVKDVVLKMKYKIGVNGKGEDVFRDFSLNTIHLSATKEKISELSNIVAKYIDFPMSQVTKVTTYVIKK